MKFTQQQHKTDKVTWIWKKNVQCIQHYNRNESSWGVTIQRNKILIKSSLRLRRMQLQRKRLWDHPGCWFTFTTH